jgi:hypothetical protein
MIFAAVPAIGRSPYNRETGQDTGFPSFVICRFHDVALVLDTLALYWYNEGDPKLSSVAQTLIRDAANEILISPASYWEIAVKVCIGQWSMNRPYEEFIDWG